MSARWLLTTWLTQRQNELNLEIIENSYIKKWVPEYFDIIVNMTFNKTVISGRAQDKNKFRAIEKACAEAMERLAWEFSRRSKKLASTNGWAAHRNKKLATVGAVNELIERDLFICHYLSKTGFLVVSERAPKFRQTVLKILARRLRSVGVRLVVGLLPSEFGHPAVVCMAFGHSYKFPFGVMVGLSRVKNIKQAADKAALECLVGLMPILAGAKPKVISKSHFQKMKYFTPDANDQFGLHKSQKTILAQFFSNSVPPMKRPLRSKLKSFKTRVVKLPSFFKGCPIVVVCSSHPDLQKLFFGPSRSQTINQRRFHQFLNNRHLPPTVAPMNEIIPFG